MKKPSLLFAIAIFALFDVCVGAALFFKYRSAPALPSSASKSLTSSEVSSKTPAEGANPTYTLSLISEEKIQTGHSAKSVLFDPAGEFLYSLNLEEGSVYAFERKTRKVGKKLFFDKTPTTGYNYETRKWNERSTEEKPVEGCFSHGGKYLWISLHNAKGVVAWNVVEAIPAQKGQRKAKLEQNGEKSDIALHFMPTGTTPKVIALHPSGKHLFVANWHSNTVTVLNIEGHDQALWHKVCDIPVSGTPRGMAFSQDGKTLYVAQMGAGSITLVNAEIFKVEGRVEIGPTPRHLLSHHNQVYASMSSAEQLAKFSNGDFKKPKTAKTLDDPRTIALSDDGQFVFVACYGASKVQLFRASDLKLLETFSSPGSPVGVALWQDSQTLEAWVVNYRYDTIKIWSFARKAA